jgi:nitrite reductase (NADH) small subunit
VTAAATKAASHNLGPVERIPPGEGRTFVIDGADLAVFRGRDGSIFATQAKCPHREGPLADGLVGGGTVICPLHAYKFRLSDGSAVGHDCGTLQTYRAWLDDSGSIWLEK